MAKYLITKKTAKLGKIKVTIDNDGITIEDELCNDDVFLTPEQANFVKWFLIENNWGT